MRKIRSKCLCYFFVLIAPAVLCFGGDGQATMIRQIVWEEATRSLDPNMPGPVERFNSVLASRGITPETAKPILVDYAHGKDLPDDYPDLISDFSVRVLVGWRSREILPILIQAATQTIDAQNDMSRNARNGALARVMSIGGNEALQLARDVVNNSQQYGSLERFYVYESLARHLLPEDAQQIDDSFRADVADFLRSMVHAEPNAASIEVIDRALAKYSDEYRTSDQRENILVNHENTSLPYPRQYIREALSDIRENKERQNSR